MCALHECLPCTMGTGNVCSLHYCACLLPVFSVANSQGDHQQGTGHRKPAIDSKNAPLASQLPSYGSAYSSEIGGLKEPRPSGQAPLHGPPGPRIDSALASRLNRPSDQDLNGNREVGAYQLWIVLICDDWPLHWRSVFYAISWSPMRYLG